MRSDVALLRQVTPHWFRHRLATVMLATGDIRSAMEQGGWEDSRSLLGYAHDVPQRRRALILAMDAPDQTTKDDITLIRARVRN